MFSKLKKATCRVETVEASPLRSLPEGTIEQVTGGSGCWMDMVFPGMGVRKVWHSGYPPAV